MTYQILIVDSNKAFATMLQESLEQGSDCRATVATGGDEALQALTAAEFDLAIVDLGLTDQDGATLARALRQQRADLRLMLIPLMGEELPSELADLDVQGVLPKPFFLPELPGRIADALARPVGGGPDLAEVTEPDISSGLPVVSSDERPVVSSDERLAVLREHISEIIQGMNALSQEINAEAVILTCRGKLIAHTGRLSAEGSDALAQVVAESWRTSARVAQILGQEQLRFEQSTEGCEYVFYSLAVTQDVILSAALHISVPLGTIRHRAKSTADALRALIKKG
ncbi:MAG: response regulator transcription factor [Chloroflexi bacterium]|nr:response regulator transcription factor [Chloroflexota bacterium]